MDAMVKPWHDDRIGWSLLIERERGAEIADG
jgi:hypothetical protein